MFVNISNHPSEKWGKAQLEAAMEYGDIVDIPFPNVKPEATCEEVRAMAEKLRLTIEQLEEVSGKDVKMIHLVGEPTLTVAAISLLIHKYHICTSTTKRIVTENADGTITKAFEFVKFREYETLSWW